MAPSRMPRPGFSLVLAASAVMLVLGITLALLTDSVLALALGTVLIAGAWLVPAMYAVRYRTQAQFRKTASGEDVRLAQRTLVASIKQVREQTSRADNRRTGARRGRGAPAGRAR